MRCIFCKKDSSKSISIEHVIPESLGNKKTVLPKGAVCDSCNNYFASKVEKYVLESGEFTTLRFNQRVSSKKGRIPSMNGIIIPGYPATIELFVNPNPYIGVIQTSDEAVKVLLKNKNGKIFFPASGESPTDFFTSRFLAKMALEAIAFRVCAIEGWNDFIVEETQFDSIRNYARSPKRGEIRKYSKRKIYDENSVQRGNDGVDFQVLNEWDILMIGDIEYAEYYFIIVIFGVEYAINVGGSCMEGYEKWLKSNNYKSPLYIGKNTM